MKLFCNLIFILVAFIYIHPEENILIKDKIAKIGNDLILKKNVDTYAKFNNLSFDEAKKKFIDIKILLTGAKMYSKEPTDKEINAYFKSLKADYAGKVGKEVKNITDEEFVRNLNANNFSLVSYRNDIKNEIWINNYIDEIIESKKLTRYTPSEEDKEKLINSNPGLFQEKEGVYFSMIFITFYNGKGDLKKADEREKLNKTAQACLEELKNKASFESMVDKYSTDLVSKNNKPKGRAGFLAFDDPRALINFSADIINELKKSNIGIVYNIFKTKNGLYIFKIDEKVKPDILTGENAKMKAESVLNKEYEINLKQSVIKEIIKDVSEKIEITIY